MGYLTRKSHDALRHITTARGLQYDIVGKNWSEISTIIAGETHVLSLVNLGNGVVLAGTYPLGKIARSTDYGTSWSSLGTIIAGETYIYSFVNLGNGVILAGTGPLGKIARSTDYGVTWTSLGTIIAGETYIYSLVNLGNGVVLAGTAPNGKIARSTDYGLTWSSLGTIIAGETQISSLVNLGNGVALAGTGPLGKIARSTDYGLTWTSLGTIIAGETYILSFVNLGNGVVLAGTSTNNKIAKSTDYGASWANLGTIIAGETHILSLVNLGNGVVLAGTIPLGKIARSTDYGATWTSLGTIITGETYIYSLVNLGNGVVLAGTYPLGKIARSDQGLNEFGQPETEAGGISIHAADKTSVHAFDSDGLLTAMPGIAKSQIILDSGTANKKGSILVNTSGNIAIGSNCYFDGNWQRFDVAAIAEVIHISVSSGIEVYRASAGANPITWDLANGVVISGTDGKVPDANLQSPVATHVAATAPHASHAIIASGTYTGDGSANRAIAHGLSRTPKAWFANSPTTGAQVSWITGTGYIGRFYDGGTEATTAPTSTNIYVGGASGTYGNTNTVVYYWVAFG